MPFQEQAPRPNSNSRAELRAGYSGIMCMVLANKMNLLPKPLDGTQKAELASLASQPSQKTGIDYGASLEASKAWVDGVFHLNKFKGFAATRPNGEQLWRETLRESAGIPSGALNGDLAAKAQAVDSFATFTWGLSDSMLASLSPQQKEALIENRAQVHLPIWRSAKSQSGEVVVGAPGTQEYQASVQKFRKNVDEFAERTYPRWQELMKRLS